MFIFTKFVNNSEFKKYVANMNATFANDSGCRAVGFDFFHFGTLFLEDRNLPWPCASDVATFDYRLLNISLAVSSMMFKAWLHSSRVMINGGKAIMVL